MTRAMTTPPLLEVADLTRRFHGVVAVDHVDFDVRPGEVHALVGENGAGKSTVINIIGGVLQPSSGSILVDGLARHLPTPASAQDAGISVIFQEFNLLPHLSVAENIYINREPTRGPVIDWSAMERGSTEVLQRLGLSVDPRIAVDQLSVAQQQLVEIARALSFKSRVIVMDEPTASLSDREADRLLEIVRDLAAAGHGDHLRLPSPGRGARHRRPRHGAPRRATRVHQAPRGTRRVAARCGDGRPGARLHDVAAPVSRGAAVAGPGLRRRSRRGGLVRPACGRGGGPGRA